MKLSLNWLASYFTQDIDFDLVFDKLTMAGIEIEAVEPVAPDFSLVVVAEVVECTPHPNADKLNVCKVNIGNNEIVQIVCGAKNVQVGIKVPCALVGGELPNDFKIASREMRGVESFGMLCSSDELGITGYDTDGLLVLPDSAPVGQSIRSYLDLDDKIVEFKITPNRSDCLSVNGILREIRALTEYPVNLNPCLPSNQLEQLKSGQLVIDNQQVDVCPNYHTLVINGIDNSVKLPEYIYRRLKASGQRSISAVVDLINYVMLEIGQPMHAFDLAKVSGDKLVVRYANENEQLKLLDGKTATLKTDTLLIADGYDTPLAIAGVMGGFDSGVTIDSTSIILESAFFVPQVIMGRTKAYGVSSDSAYRFERGVDYSLQSFALEYVANLITKYCGGTLNSYNYIQADCLSNITISLSLTEINAKIGQDIQVDIQQGILNRLGFKYELNGDQLLVTPPCHRFDIKIAEDIIEEIARVYGYDNIQPIMPVASYAIKPIDIYRDLIVNNKQKLQMLGYSEIVSYAFIEEQYEEMLGNKSVNMVKLLNSIAGFGVMRTSLLAGMIKTLIHNINRGHKRVKIFELARVFYGEDEDTQPIKLAGLVYGPRHDIAWCNKNDISDFFDMKQDVLNIFTNIEEVRFIPLTTSDVLHTGRAASIMVGNQEIGHIGQLHPRVSQSFDIAGVAPYIFELDFDKLAPIQNDIRYREVSKFQKVERDLSFILNHDQNVGDILLAIKSIDIPYLIDAYVFDVYVGENLDTKQKSIGLSFIFQGFKTLVDDEINKSTDMIIDLVTNKFGAVLRK